MKGEITLNGETYRELKKKSMEAFEAYMALQAQANEALESGLMLQIQMNTFLDAAFEATWPEKAETKHAESDTEVTVMDAIERFIRSDHPEWEIRWMEGVLTATVDHQDIAFYGGNPMAMTITAKIEEDHQLIQRLNQQQDIWIFIQRDGLIICTAYVDPTLSPEVLVTMCEQCINQYLGNN